MIEIFVVQCSTPGENIDIETIWTENECIDAHIPKLEYLS